MLRTLLVLALVVAGILYSLQGAFYVLLFYLWNAYFRPEQWAWSAIIGQLRLSLTIGIALILSSFFSTDRFRWGLGPTLLFAFLLQSLLSTLLAADPTLWSAWIEFAKVIVICYLITTLVNTEDRLRLAIVVIALSLGFEGARQGWANLILRPGARNMNDWPMLGDNNGVAIGMLMLVPLLVVLAQTTKDRSRYLGWFLAMGVAYRGISTYSRGGFLAASALILYMILHSKRRLRWILGTSILAACLYLLMPPAYWGRIGTVQDAADTTEAGRVGFWKIGLDMANDHPVFGVGVDGYRRQFDRYDPTGGAFGHERNIHSSWFGVLAELGYPGLFLFFVIIAHMFYVGHQFRRAARTRPELTMLAAYATAFEAQLVAFAVGGTFITLQYKELTWHMFALSMAAHGILKARLAESDRSRQPGEVHLTPTSGAAARLVSRPAVGPRHP